MGEYKQVDKSGESYNLTSLLQLVEVAADGSILFATTRDKKVVNYRVRWWLLFNRYLK